MQDKTTESNTNQKFGFVKLVATLGIIGMVSVFLITGIQKAFYGDAVMQMQQNQKNQN